MGTNIIKKTNDYSLFKFYNFNRPINQSLVKRLKESIQKIGFIMGNPVLVDKDYTIKDGQHRFTALMELGMPIYYYIVEEGDPHEIVTALNAQQVTWKMDDYVHSWADQGVSCYVKLQDFRTKYGLNMSQAVMILFKGGDDGGDAKGIKAGKHYPINPEYQRIIDFMLYCKDFLPYWKSSYFVRGVVRLFKIATDAQVEKIKKHIITLPQQAAADSYLVAFENMVNKGVPANKRITFKTKV